MNTKFNETGKNGQVVYPSNIYRREKPLLIVLAALVVMNLAHFLIGLSISLVVLFIIPFSFYFFFIIIPKAIIEEVEIRIEFDEEYSRQVPEQQKLGIMTEEIEKQEKRVDILVNLENRQELEVKAIEKIGIFEMKDY